MRKIKVGDKVKMLRGFGTTLIIGDVGIVERILATSYQVRFGHSQQVYHLKEHEITPLK